MLDISILRFYKRIDSNIKLINIRYIKFKKILKFLIVIKFSRFISLHLFASYIGVIRFTCIYTIPCCTLSLPHSNEIRFWRIITHHNINVIICLIMLFLWLLSLQRAATAFRYSIANFSTSVREEYCSGSKKGLERCDGKLINPSPVTSIFAFALNGVARTRKPLPSRHRFIINSRVYAVERTGGGPNGQSDCFEWRSACVIYFAQLKYLINRRRANR